MVRWIVLGLAASACAEPPPPVQREPWSSIALPDGRRRLESAVAALGTQLVMAGGYSTSLREGLAITDEVIALDTLTGEWHDLPSSPVRWTHGALAGNGGAVFLLGGHEDVHAMPSGQAFVLELGAETWVALPAMPPGFERGAAGVLVSPPFVYLFGGANAVGPLATNLRFDLIARTWSRRLPDLPTARSHPAVTELDDGTIVIAGGLDDANRPLGDVWRLLPDFVTPPEDQLWKLGDPMPTDRGGCAYGTAFGALLCAGGEAGAVALDVVERYDPDGAVVGGEAIEQWSELPRMPEPRAGAQGVAIGGRLYVVGGSVTRAFEPTDSVLEFSYVDTLGAGSLGSR